jgi:hypothetical protein
MYICLCVHDITYTHYTLCKISVAIRASKSLERANVSYLRGFRTAPHTKQETHRLRQLQQLQDCAGAVETPAHMKATLPESMPSYISSSRQIYPGNLFLDPWCHAVQHG